jgi:hypothetical protein
MHLLKKSQKLNRPTMASRPLELHPFSHSDLRPSQSQSPKRLMVISNHRNHPMSKQQNRLVSRVLKVAEHQQPQPQPQQMVTNHSMNHLKPILLSQTE